MSRRTPLLLLAAALLMVATVAAPASADVGCTSSSIVVSSFNGTEIAPGSTLWFNAIVKVKGAGDGTVVDYAGTITLDGDDHAVASRISFSDAASVATTEFVGGAWVTTVPAGYSGNVFLSGLALELPTGLRKGVKDVAWSGTFTSVTDLDLEFQWKWSAAVYTEFGDHADLMVKPLDGDKFAVEDGPFDNSHHAGTPEAFTEFVTGGARGGGGSNFTGSYSGTGKGTCTVSTGGTPSGSIT